MSDGLPHPALARLALFERRYGEVRHTPSGGTPRPVPKMGYQSTLDGVRAVSVLAVILYHAGFSWMHGGFFGVEVFFVVSGFLITSLLIEERDGSGKVSLRQFWLRRARRLLPALFAVLIAVGVWAVFWGNLPSSRATCGATTRGASSTSPTGGRSSATPRTSGRRPRCCATCGAWRWKSSGIWCGRWCSWWWLPAAGPRRATVCVAW